MDAQVNVGSRRLEQSDIVFGGPIAVLVLSELDIDTRRDSLIELDRALGCVLLRCDYSTSNSMNAIRVLSEFEKRTTDALVSLQFMVGARSILEKETIIENIRLCMQDTNEEGIVACQNIITYLNYYYMRYYPTELDNAQTISLNVIQPETMISILSSFDALNAKLLIEMLSANGVNKNNLLSLVSYISTFHLAERISILEYLVAVLKYRELNTTISYCIRKGISAKGLGVDDLLADHELITGIERVMTKLSEISRIREEDIRLHELLSTT